MEKIENGCILLKQKEYDELLEKSEVNRSKEILIKFGYYSNVTIDGNITLSDNLKKQIINICKMIDNKSLSYIQNREHDIRENYRYRGVSDAIDKFENLRWYQRLFFKPSYVRD